MRCLRDKGRLSTEEVIGETMAKMMHAREWMGRTGPGGMTFRGHRPVRCKSHNQKVAGKVLIRRAGGVAAAIAKGWAI